VRPGIRLNSDRNESIVVFRIGSLGDTISSLPALREVRRRHPSERIVLLTNSPVDGGLRAASSVQVLTGMQLVDDFVEYPHGSRNFLSLARVMLALRTRRARICYYLVGGRTQEQIRRDRFFFQVSGIRKYVGMTEDAMHHRAPEPGQALWESEAKRTLRAVNGEGRSISTTDFSLDLSEEERNTASRALREAGIRSPYLVVCVGSKAPAKDWGNDRWRNALEILSTRIPHVGLVGIGAASERGRTDDVLDSWTGAKANLCGLLLPRESGAVIEGAALYMGHDSGPMHLANAVGTPIVAVFAARSQPGIWFPHGQEAGVFYRDVPCAGCGLDVCTVAGHICMSDIRATDVAQRACEVLDHNRARLGASQKPKSLA